MAFDAFLKIDGIPGESLTQKHKGEILISSFSWGVQQQGSAGGGSGGGAGKATFQDFHFVAHAGKQSPLLMLACASGKHIPKAILTLRKSGQDQLDFTTITLTDCLVSGFAPNGDRGLHEDRPAESISLNFTKIEWSQTVQNTGEVVDVIVDFSSPPTP